MFPLGFFLTAMAMYLVDCAVTNKPPVKTLEAIFRDPSNLRETLGNARGTGFASTVPTDIGGVSGSAALPGLLNPGGVLGGSVDGIAAVAWARAQIGKPY